MLKFYNILRCYNILRGDNAWLLDKYMHMRIVVYSGKAFPVIAGYATFFNN